MTPAVLVAHPALPPLTQHCLRVLVEHPEGVTESEARRLGCGHRFPARVLEIRKALGQQAVEAMWESRGRSRWVRYFWRGSIEPQGELFLGQASRTGAPRVAPHTPHTENIR